MPIFHLHIRSADTMIHDEEGIELADLAAACEEATRGARSIMCADVLAGSLRLDQSIEVHDAAGALLATVRFRDAVDVANAD